MYLCKKLICLRLSQLVAGSLKLTNF